MATFLYGEDFLECKHYGETVRIVAWGENSLRVLATPFGKIDSHSHALLSQKSSAQVVVEENYGTIQNGKITARIQTQGGGSEPVIISFYNEKGEPILQEISRGGALVRKGRDFHSHLDGNYQLTVTFEAQENEKIYGMGQYQQDILDLKGCILELAHKNTQASIPFYISNKGYGFLWHNPAIGKVSFGKNRTEWQAMSSNQLDYWITVGDTPAKIEEQFTSVTGRAPLMPEHGLGFWQCKLRYHNQEEVLRVAREYNRLGVPLDVIIIDYYHWPRCGDFRFDEEFFPDPKAMSTELESLGIKPMVSIWPQIDTRSENYKEMYEKGLLVKTNHGINVQMIFHGNNVFYDPTNPEARKYVWEKCKKNYVENGIEHFWLDEAEPEFGVYDYDNYRYHEGSVLQIGNIYPREFARGFYEGQVENGQKEIVNLIRCAWVGSQRYGSILWSGDIHNTYKDFKNQICIGIQVGLSGIPWWTTDIGGFWGCEASDPDFQDLLIRWFQFGAFSPVMRAHGNRQPRTPIFKSSGEETEATGAPNEIWSYGQENFEIMKKYIEIRGLIKDYTRKLMLEAHENGSPIIRAMFYEFPNDQIAWDLSTQYMYGSDLLVAPIINAYSYSREVYLPLGAEWKYTHTGETFKGGQWVTVSAPIETIPVFTRDNTHEYLINQI